MDQQSGSGNQASKIRICLDPQKLNKVIQRTWGTVTYCKLSKDRIFTTQNEKDGFYQFKSVFTTPSAN